MSSTKGSAPTPNLNRIIKDVVQHTALMLYFDISKEAHEAGLFDMLILDVIKPRWEHATHTFYVVINKNVACYVSRTTDNGYIFEPDRENPYFAQELEIREQVLCVALKHFTGKSADPKDALKLVQELLGDTMTANRMPVIRDERPDILPLGTGDAELQAERQWSVQIGDYACEIALFGTDDNGNPLLVVLGEEERDSEHGWDN
jgi:hypothetical protein